MRETKRAVTCAVYSDKIRALIGAKFTAVRADYNVPDHVISLLHERWKKLIAIVGMNKRFLKLCKRCLL